MTAPVHVLSTRMFSETWLDGLRAIDPRIVVRQETGEIGDDIPSDVWDWAHVVYTWGAFPDPVRHPNVQWVQLDTAGYDAALRSPLGSSDVRITTLNGVAPPNMAEHTLMMMLAIGHRLPDMLRKQQAREWPPFEYRWNRFTPSELHGKTVAVVGYGSIGEEIGRIAHAFGMKVIAVSPAPRADKLRHLIYQIPALIGLTGTEPDERYTPDRLLEALPLCDYVVLCLPHTPASHHLMNEAAFRAMKPSAALINVARGGVVDEDALILALQEGWLAAAALDVFEVEPLTTDSPLWAMENVILSPHVAGLTGRYFEVVFDLFSNNLRRYLAGEPLLNQVYPPRTG